MAPRSWTPFFERLLDLATLALAIWYTHRITAQATGQESHKLALEHTAGVIRQQAQLLGEYSKMLDVLRDVTIRTVADAIAMAHVLAGGPPPPRRTLPTMTMGMRTSGPSAECQSMLLNESRRTARIGEQARGWRSLRQPRR